MFLYIGVTPAGVTRFDCEDLRELIVDIASAHGPHSVDEERFEQISSWAEAAQPGAVLQLARGWILRRSYTPVQEVAS